jgi:DNA-binding MarR family transcriptional regulator
VAGGGTDTEGHIWSDDKPKGMSTSASEEELSEDERRGLELIRDTGGIHQSNFWKELDVSSRKGSRIVDSLSERGLIEREETVYQGHNTYHLSPTAQDLDFSLLMAGDMLSPFIGDEEIDAQSDTFSQWVMNLAYEE